MTQALPTAFEDRVLEDVLKLAKSEKTGLDGNGEPTSAFAYYVEQLVRYATGEDEIWTEPAAILKRAQDGWALGQTRAPGENKCTLNVEDRAGSQDRKLTLSIITEDKPFLVDSISAALSEAGRTLTFFSNAVSDVQRDVHGERLTDLGGEPYRESMIRAEMEAPVSDQEIADLKAEIDRVLHDVAAAVTDWEPMRARLAACIAQLERSRVPGLKGDEQRESIEFLKWLWDNRFAFLGVRRIKRTGHNGASRFEHDEDGDLGILRDKERRILRGTFASNGELSAPVAAFLNSEEPILIAKANSKSVVHRRVHMDYVGVKTYAIDGNVTGEERFVGLFTADAYNRPATDIPSIRAKVQAVLDGTRFNPGGHNEKALINILETYPRDELFQIDVPTLREISLGVLRLFKRPRAKLFIRRDRFDRYVSALVYVPRDRFNSDIREQIGKMIAAAFDGRVSAYYPHFGEAALVRVHFIIGLNPGAPEGPGVVELTRRVRDICRDWSDDLLEAMRQRHSGASQVSLFTKYERAFTAGYRDKTPLDETLYDIDCLERLAREETVIRAYRAKSDPDHIVRLKIYRRNGPLPLSGLVPTIENLDLDIVQENGFAINPAGVNDSQLWIHDFYTEQGAKQPVDLDSVSGAAEEALLAVLDGRTEDDGFNALVLTAGVTWREAWLLRTAAKHHLQGKVSYSQSYMEETLANHPKIAKDLVTAFHARFDPEGPSDFDQRRQNMANADAVILDALNDVASLDEDRIIRRFLNLFGATTRTNFYQRLEDGSPKPYISIKIESRRLEELPEPRPFREIFMSGPRVDGVLQARSANARRRRAVRT
ncbi:MAG: NAD-glutamate dehydrogenase domain-containing protein [Pseudomonadota bacterium]